MYDAPEIEYVDGLVYPKVSPRLSHSVAQGTLGSILREKAKGRGVVGPGLRLDPGAIDGSKTEFVPDIAFVSYERLRVLSGEAREKPPFSPDIAVEVRSPSDDLRYLARKIARYLATGALLVLDVDPAKRRVIAHTADGIRTFEGNDVFAHPSAPWLTFEVRAIFADLDTV